MLYRMATVNTACENVGHNDWDITCLSETSC